ncbi:MAG: gliding motility-associated C-terminal domain-containing protein, partial [Bacteroidetes bacterium]|nr:gliding motility-associated C-terminal domain-containing protein [Bacteroidota bacterium]
GNILSYKPFYGSSKLELLNGTKPVLVYNTEIADTTHIYCHIYSNDLTRFDSIHIDAEFNRDINFLSINVVNGSLGFSFRSATPKNLECKQHWGLIDTNGVLKFYHEDPSNRYGMLGIEPMLSRGNDKYNSLLHFHIDKDSQIYNRLMLTTDTSMGSEFLNIPRGIKFLDYVITPDDKIDFIIQGAFGSAYDSLFWNGIEIKDQKFYRAQVDIQTKEFNLDSLPEIFSVDQSIVFNYQLNDWIYGALSRQELDTYYTQIAIVNLNQDTLWQEILLSNYFLFNSFSLSAGNNQCCLTGYMTSYSYHIISRNPTVFDTTYNWLQFPSHLNHLQYELSSDVSSQPFLFNIDLSSSTPIIDRNCSETKVYFDNLYPFKTPEFIFKDGSSVTTDTLVISQLNQDTTIDYKLESLYGYRLNESLVLKSTKVLSSIPDHDTTCQHAPTLFQPITQTDTIHAIKGESFIWEFWQNDTVWHSSTERNPKITFTRLGWFTVKMNYSNGFCDDWIIKDSAIYVQPARKPGFAFDKANVCAPVEIGIQDRSSGVPAKISYTRHQFKVEGLKFKVDTSGVFSVVQLCETDNGCITTDTQRIRVKEGFGPESKHYPLLVKCNAQNKVQIYWDSLQQKSGFIERIGSHTRTAYGYNYTDQATKADSGVYNYRFFLLDSCDRNTKPVLFQNLLLKYDELNEEIYWNQPLVGEKLKVKGEKLVDGVWQMFAEPTENQLAIADLNGLVRVVAFDSILGVRFESNIIDLNAQMAFPNAFSPNDDGINDVLAFSAIDAEEFDITIFSRWGQMVATSVNPLHVWDGKINGEIAPVGVYYYVLKTETEIKKGTIHLIR